MSEFLADPYGIKIYDAYVQGLADGKADWPFTWEDVDGCAALRVL